MIKKIYFFNEKIGTLLIRTYENTMSDDKIREMVLLTNNCNFINGEDTIIFKKQNDVYICFIVENENEVYILEIIDYFVNLIKIEIGEFTNINMLHNFKSCFILLDKFVINGKLIRLCNENSVKQPA